VEQDPSEGGVFPVELISRADEGTSCGRVAGTVALTFALPISLWSAFRLALSVFEFISEPRLPAFIALVFSGGAVFVCGFALRALYRYFSRRLLVVASDGIVVASVRGSRFVPFDAIVEVEEDPRGARLVLHGDASVVLPVDKLPRDDARADPRKVARASRHAALVARIERARRLATRSEQRGSTGAKLALLDRSGRPVEAWKEAIVKLARPDPGYRDVGFDGEELVRIVEDPAMSAERRAAAAVVIHTSRDDALIARVRVASASCADVDLRRALEEAASEGELLEDEIASTTNRRLAKSP
jgi:hypothetical protein